MATIGWLGEQTINSWGSYNSRLTTNVYVNGIRRYNDHIDVSGVIYLFCKSSGARTVWYDWAITAWCGGANLGQIKPRTYNNNIINRSWGKNFTVRINCSNSDTSATFHVGFSDSNMGGRDKYWTLYFDRYATSPSGIKSTSSYTKYSTITTSCSGINWGQGYSSRKLTCTASYTFNGKTENFTIGTWTDGETSKTVTKSDFNFPADLNVSVKWIASTNVGSATTTTQVKVGKTYPAPNLSNVELTVNSPSAYKINATVTGINYGENYLKRVANLYFDYILDGISYSTLLYSISDGSTSITVDYDATTESEPWKFIPDDEKGTLRLVVDNGYQTSTKSSGQIYCQPQYEVYIIEPIPDSEKVYTQKQTTNGYLQETNNLEHGEIAEINSLIGNATQNGTPTQDAPISVNTVTGEQTVRIAMKNLWGGFENDFLKTNRGISFTNNADGSIAVNGTADGTALSIVSAEAREQGRIIYLKSGTYTISGATTTVAIEVVNSNGTEIAETQGRTSTSFTISTDSKVFVRAKVNEGVAVDNVTIYPQLEFGSTATTYEPYQGQSNIINLSSIELAKIGDYQDRIYKTGGKWYIEKKTSKVILNGTERWQRTALTSGARFFTINNNLGLKNSSSDGTDIISDHFAGVSYDLNYSSGGVEGISYSYYNNNHYIHIFSLNETFTDVASFTSWLSSNPITVYYSLENQTTVEITNKELIKQLDKIYTFYNGESNIFIISSSDAQSDVNFNVYTNWQKITPAILSVNGKNGTGQFKQIRRIGTK